MRAIRSLIPAPLAAANEFPVWRRSWKCRPCAPIDSTDILLKLLRRSGDPFAPAKPPMPGLQPRNGQMVAQGRDDRIGNADSPTTGAGLQRAECDLTAPCTRVREGRAHRHQARLQVKIAPLECGDLTPAQAREGG